MSKFNKSSPRLFIDDSPPMIDPVSKSIRSGNFSASSVLVDIFSVGVIGFPVGVPRPVEKTIKFAPDPAMAVVDSTSPPGVQRSERPLYEPSRDNQEHQQWVMSHLFLQPQQIL